MCNKFNLTHLVVKFYSFGEKNLNILFIILTAFVAINLIIFEQESVFRIRGPDIAYIPIANYDILVIPRLTNPCINLILISFYRLITNQINKQI